LLGLAGTVTEELFPAGMGAVLAKDLSKQSIAEAAVPILRSPELAAKLGRAASATVNAMYLQEHFFGRLRQALAPMLAVPKASATSDSITYLKKRNTSASVQVVSSKNRES
jgi:hypothetical protein